MGVTGKNWVWYLLVGGALSFGIGFYIFLGGNNEAQDRSRGLRFEDNLLKHSFESIETSSKIGTAWGVSPFQKGNPITDNETQGLVFHTPNLEWKAKNVTLYDGRTLNYQFGSGNPQEAAPLSEKEKISFKSCGVDGHPNLFAGCPPDGYITSDVEKKLVDLLSDQNWGALLTKCKSDFTNSDFLLRDDGLKYADVIQPGYFDIEGWLTVDADTGRKKLTQKFIDTKGWYVSSLDDQSGSDNVATVKSCFLQNGGRSIFEKFLVMENMLYTPD